MSKAARTRKDDLVYYMHDGAAEFRFRLCGDLSGDAVHEVEQAWRTASSIIRGRSLLVDLSSVTGMDDAGRAFLERWQAEGARMVAGSAAAKGRIQSMLARQVSFRVALRWVAVLLVALYPAVVNASGRCELPFHQLYRLTQ